MSEECGWCQFFKDDCCRRRAPHPVQSNYAKELLWETDKSEVPTAVWPQVNSSDWCGEFEPYLIYAADLSDMGED